MDGLNLLDRLLGELERLEADRRFSGTPEAIEALEAVKFWAMEESVECAESSPR